MITVGIRELKNSLSRFLRSVKAGEEIVVTERGKPIARIEQEPPLRSAEARRRYRHLVEEGAITPPSKPRRRQIPRPPRAPGKPLSQIVIENRE